MGASIEVRYLTAEGKEPIGIIEATYTDRLVGCEIPSQHIASEIDEIPVLALVAAHAAGITVFRGVSELTKKESNRLTAIIEGLEKLGVNAGLKMMICTSRVSLICRFRRGLCSTRARIIVSL